MKVILLLFITTMSFGQTFEKFIIINSKGKQIKGTFGRFVDNTFNGINSDDEPFTLKGEEIHKLLIQKDEMITYGIIGLLVGGVTGVVLQENQGGDKQIGIILGSSVLGALIGGGIGSRIDSWEVVSLPIGNSNLSFENTISINLKLFL